MRQGSPPPPPPPPEDDYVDVQNVPTPQTDRYRVISRSSRFWYYVYNDPKYRLLLASAVIVTIYFIIKVVDAVNLYNRLYEQLVAMSTAPELLRSYTMKWFLDQLPVVHYVSITLAFVFNWLAWLIRRPWCALVAAVCYLVAAISYISWAIFLLPSLILITICYMSMVRKKNRWL